MSCHTQLMTVTMPMTMTIATTLTRTKVVTQYPLIKRAENILMDLSLGTGEMLKVLN